jgi:hypothetical protein
VQEFWVVAVFSSIYELLHPLNTAETRNEQGSQGRTNPEPHRDAASGVFFSAGGEFMAMVTVGHPIAIDMTLAAVFGHCAAAPSVVTMVDRLMTRDVAIGIGTGRQQIIILTGAVVITMMTTALADLARHRDLAPVNDGVHMDDPGMVPECGGTRGGSTGSGGGDDGNGDSGESAIHGLVLGVV